MGAWGSGPYDNDSAADWFFGLGEIGLYDLIERGLKDGGYNEQRAAAWLVQRLAISPYVYDVYLIDEHRELAVEKLKDILDDQDWLDSWRDPDETIAEIKQQIDEIEDSIASPGLIEQMRDLDDVPDKGVPNVEVAETLDDAVDVRNKRQQDYMRTDLSHLEQLAKADAKAREKALLEYRKTLRQRHTQG